MKRYLLPVLSLLLVLSACSKDGEETPNETEPGERTAFGGARRDGFSMAVPADDGGYVILGNTRSVDGDIQGKSDTTLGIWLVAMDTTGNIKWQKTFDAKPNLTRKHIINAHGGGYIIMGATSSKEGSMSGNHGFTDAWVAKIDAKGNLLWSKMFGTQDEDYPMELAATPDGNYTLCGFQSPGGWLLKFDDNGNVLWDIQPHYAFFFCAVATATDGSSLVAGFSFTNVLNVHDGLLRKYDKNGEMVWQKLYERGGNEELYYVIPSGNGTYFLSGKTTDANGDTHPFFLSVNENGEVLWENILNNVKGYADYAIKAPDRNYLAVLNYPGARLFKINGATGALMNSAAIGGTEEYLANALAAIGNGRFVILGASNASSLVGAHGDWDAWAYKFSF